MTDLLRRPVHQPEENLGKFDFPVEKAMFGLFRQGLDLGDQFLLLDSMERSQELVPIRQIEVIAREISAPKLINIVAGGLTPQIEPAALRELGYAVAIYPTTALLAATNAVAGALRGIGGQAVQAQAVQAQAVTPVGTMEDFFRLVGLDEWFAVSERWETK